MNNLWIYNEVVLKKIKFLFEHRQSMGKVKLYFNVAGLLLKVYRGIASLLRKVAVNQSAIDISTCFIHLSVSENLHILSPNLSTLCVSTTKKAMYPYL